MTKSAEAIILAGGYGSRMGEHTRERQKCLLPIDEKPTLYHILDNLVDAFGSVDVKIGVAYKAEQVKEYVDRYINSRSISVTYVPHKPGSESFLAYQTMKPYIHTESFTITPGDIIALPCELHTSK